MSDQDIIQDAYAEKVRGLFAVFFQNNLAAKTSADRAKAEEQFQAGLNLARTVRERALALL